ncbi:hypothetical protein [Streptomyces narbonensis]|uniref:hypothetical protein n=1 Tax=Streptomyces narbonensis TaxID=67333 RepID=UPI0016771B88|nr:hypothetical protein [Streptomyces narbonensis]GGW10993.1 hypothetical protein GCM10010230_63370 [Streptomyces narbonensis]
MSGHFTDRDERMWQQRAEERTARPLAIGAWLRALLRAARVSPLIAPAPTRPSRIATGGSAQGG